ncbi:MAG TPA: DUF488 domain-containing protein [Acidobacteriota bacterium]
MSQSAIPNPQSAIKEVFTIGHSTRPAEAFFALLRSHSIVNLVDVRSFPGSRKYPQYNQEKLSSSLSTEGISYHHLKSLGGFRKPRKSSSANDGWKNEGFRGYADYMETAEFHAGLEELLRIASSGPTAIMCAEATPWRCHRQLIADALVGLKKLRVTHIIGSGKTQEHHLTPFARVEGERLEYPGEEALFQ